ncbi:hypothetical protein vBEcoMWL3_gp059 [Escherichia phage vB_EcoM_WL-3]|nr:hypothetical protein vBEcoMWL3_gp059 [Escherichia phage vB_EcoM_WL-3]
MPPFFDLIRINPHFHIRVCSYNRRINFFD